MSTNFKMMLRKVLITIHSRRLFKNWINARIRYFLIRRGLLKARYITLRIGNKTISVPPRIYSLLINAYYDHLIHEIEVRNGDIVLDGVVKIRFVDGHILYEMPDGVKLIADDSSLLGDFGETEFVTMHQTWILCANYLGMDLRDWIIIDIGAFIGDTPLYYAKHGAFVVAIEPIETHFKAMLKNIELNPELYKRILPLNIAIAKTDGWIELAIEGIAHGGASSWQDYGRKIRVKAMSLKTLLDFLKEKNIYLQAFKVRCLKMDCEGCEYDIIMSNGDLLKMFDILLIETHGYLRNSTVNVMVSKLNEIGFKCEICSHDPFTDISVNKLATVKCYKSSI